MNAMVWFRLIALLIVLGASNLFGQRSDERIRLSIFEIFQPDGRFGTGFVVEDSLLGQILITCRHAVQDDDGNYFDKILVRRNRLLQTRQTVSDTIGFYLYLKNPDDKKDERLFFYPHPDKNIDIAIIPFNFPGETIIKRRPVYALDVERILSRGGLDSLRINEGTDVEVIGFSLTGSLMIDKIHYHFSRFGKIGLFTTEEFELEIDGIIRRANYMLLSMPIKAGDSGSPILTYVGDEMYIIGIVTAVVPDIAYGVGYPSYYIHDFLQDIHEELKSLGINAKSSRYGKLELSKPEVHE